MLIIAGLGNPGKEYENTRHNAGFMVMDALAENEIAQKERVRAVRARQREKNLAKIDRKALETESSGKLKISLCVNAILVVCVVAMFAMTLTSDSPTIVDYQSKLLNRYASWEQELTEREKAVSEKEQELGIQVDTEQTDFTVSP